MKPLDIAEQNILARWMEQSRPGAPNGYEIGDSSNDYVMQVLCEYIEAHGLPFNAKSLNEASTRPEMKAARVVVIRALWPSNHGAIAEDFMTKRVPSRYKTNGGKLPADVATRIINRIRTQFGGEVSIANLDVCLSEEYGEENIKSARAEERTKNLLEKDRLERIANRSTHSSLRDTAQNGEWLRHNHKVPEAPKSGPKFFT
jgi:hypothetical protein